MILVTCSHMLLQAPPRLKRLFYHPHFSSLSQVIGFMLKSIYAYAFMDIWIYDISALREQNNTIQCIFAIFYSVSIKIFKYLVFQFQT